MRLTVLSTFFLASLSLSSFSQTGTLDLSFGNQGKVVTNLGIDEFGRCTAVQADGKILVAGSITTTGAAGDFLIMRYKSDGTIDSTFGKKGRKRFDFRNGNDFATAIAVLADGSILLAGTTANPLDASEADFAVVKLNSDGTLDNNFGPNGRLIIDFQGRKDEGSGLAVTSDGKILVAGTTSNIDGSESAFAVAQYNSDGTLNTSFGNSGKDIIGFGINFATCNAIVIQSDNQIVLGGTLANASNQSNFALARISQGGILDNSFGGTGRVSVDLYNKNDLLNSIVLQGTKIIAAGITFNDNANTDADFGLTRINSDGTVDNTFGVQGKVKTDYNNSYNAISQIGMLANGEVVVSGSVNNSTDFGFIIAGYSADGILDNSFGTNGFTETYFTNASAAPYGMAIQTDDKIVVAGHAQANGATEDVAVARYNSDQVLPITLSSFTATKKSNSVLLNWQTASETNNNYFAIERSNSSNTNFKEIARVSSKGNSSQAQQYDFEDLAPLNGVNYYRLKQVDKNGKATTSKIVLIDFTNGVIVKLYPNPVKSNLNIDGLAGSKTTLSIIDINGKSLSTTSTTNTSYNWNIRALPAGNYYLRIEADKKINTIKFVKE
jgi:uncharacterized delta-60 repeat protein